MATNTQESIKMATRLKELRNERNLSHVKLSEALKEKYGVGISKDSLIAYEVTSAIHDKACANQGMRAESLRCLADFYDVSTDYLLGIVDEKTPNTEVRAVCSFIGLSEENVNYLHDPDGKSGITKPDLFSLKVVHSLVNDLISFCSKDMLDLNHVQMMLMLSVIEEQNTQRKGDADLSYSEAESVVNSIGMATLPALDAAKFYAREIGDAITRGFIQKYIDADLDKQ